MALIRSDGSLLLALLCMIRGLHKLGRSLPFVQPICPKRRSNQEHFRPLNLVVCLLVVVHLIVCLLVCLFDNHMSSWLPSETPPLLLLLLLLKIFEEAPSKILCSCATGCTAGTLAQRRTPSGNGGIRTDKKTPTRKTTDDLASHLLWIS